MHISCSYKLCSVYGPFAIHFYGIFIALSIFICYSLITYNRRYKQLHLERYFVDIVITSVIAGVIGGRLLDIISSPELYKHWTQWFELWNGGFSALGSILGVLLIVPLYIKKIGLPVLPIADLIAIYAPLLQSIARLGCLFAGCCYGVPSQSLFSVIYTNAQTLAPLHIHLHPTQLYSSIILFIIFLYMFFVVQKRTKYPGYIVMTYLMLASGERFIVDFWRADRILYDNLFLSFHQIIALVLFVIIVLIKVLFKK